MQRGATCRDRGWCRWLRGGVPSLSHQRPAKTHRTWQPEGTSERALFCIHEDQEAQATVLRASPPSLTLSCHPPILSTLPFFLECRLHVGHCRDENTGANGSWPEASRGGPSPPGSPSRRHLRSQLLSPLISAPGEWGERQQAA